MRRPVIIAFTLFAACGFDVNVGWTEPPPPLVGGGTGSRIDGGTGGGGTLPGCDAPPILAYDVTVPAAQLEPSCFLNAPDGGDVLPELHFTAFIVTPTHAWWESDVERIPTLGLRDLSAAQLGDTPPIKIPQAFAGQNNAFTWSDSISTRDVPNGPGRKLVVVGGLSFDRLDTPFTGGTFEISSVWTCDPDADGGCLPPRLGEVSCSSARPFTARKVNMQPEWLPAAPDGDDAGTWWLVSLDVGELVNVEDSNCSGGPPRLSSRHQDGVRSLELWQRSGDSLFLRPRTWTMADSAPLTVGPVLSGSYVEQVSRREDTAGAVETFTLAAGLTSLPFRAQSCSLVGRNASMANMLLVSSQWSCAGANCPQVTSRTSCAAGLPFEVLPMTFGAFTTTSP